MTQRCQEHLMVLLQATDDCYSHVGIDNNAMTEATITNDLNLAGNTIPLQDLLSDHTHTTSDDNPQQHTLNF